MEHGLEYRTWEQLYFFFGRATNARTKIGLKQEKQKNKKAGQQTGLILTTYCVWYPHVVLFLRNEIPLSLLKFPKTHAV